MLGLMFLLAFLIYLVIAIGVVVLVVRWAKKRNRKSWLWGGLAAFVMYNIVFWDWIPTVVAHKYYCSTQAGFWVYKTLDQWKAENPGLAKTLVLPRDRTPQTRWVSNGYVEVHPLNQRFNWVVNSHSKTFFLHISKREEEVIDAKKNEVLTRYVDFSSGDQSRPFRGIKFWLVRSGCSANEANRIQLTKLIDHLYALAKGAEK